MSIQFHETRRGAKFFDADVPNMIKATNRLAEAMERANLLAEQSTQPRLTVESVFHDELMKRILMYVTENDLDADVCRAQLVSMWTTYCLLNDYEPDTAPYDNDLLMIYNTICDYIAKDLATYGAKHYAWPANYEVFDDWMCMNLI